MMTSTSEISGKASSGMRRKVQMPANTRKSVPVKTRKRFRAHQSIHRAITLHPSRSVQRYLLVGDGLTLFPGQDRDLARSTAVQFPRALVEAIPFVTEGYR